MATCISCPVRVPNAGERCGRCTNEKREPLGPEEDLDPGPTGPPPDPKTILETALRDIHDLQKRYGFERRRTKKMSDGTSTGALEDRGLSKDMLAEAATIHRMLTDFMDMHRKWVEREEKVRAEESDVEFRERIVALLCKPVVPAEEKRAAVRRILASLGEDYITVN
jgi:hypothetical protein